MFFLQATNNSTGITTTLFLGTLGMLTLAIAIVGFVIFHQRKVIRYNNQLKKTGRRKAADFIECFHPLSGRGT